MICHYKNSRGEIVNLMKYPYHLITGDFFRYEWNEVTYSKKIYGFQQKITEKDIKLDVFCKKSEFAEAMNRLEDVFARDRIDNTAGKLYVNGFYLSCYVKKIDPSEWEAGIYSVVVLTVVTDAPQWIKEEKVSFFPRNIEISSEFLDYPLGYPFDYTASTVGTDTWDLESVSASPFDMVIYGPCTDPRIVINDHPYEIYTSLESTEYLVLDTRKHLITKYHSNGTQSSLYNNRRMDQSVFDPLPGGRLTIIWPGTFGVDITAYVERSMPKW